MPRRTFIGLSVSARGSATVPAGATYDRSVLYGGKHPDGVQE
jgi:hypothetical protein